MEITLKFNSDNCQSKYPEFHEEDVIKTTRWVVNCALTAIEEHYKDGSVRRNEMENLHRNLMNQIKSQLTEYQITNIFET